LELAVVDEGGVAGVVRGAVVVGEGEGEGAYIWEGLAGAGVSQGGRG
jgi:hypothetical protein